MKEIPKWVLENLCYYDKRNPDCTADEDEVEYDSMDNDEILRNYVHFVNWAQMQLDNPNSIDWYSLTEEKYNKLLESVYSLNQGIKCVDMLDILRVINNA